MNSDPANAPSDDDLDQSPTLRGFRAGLRLFGGRFELLRMLGRGGMGVVWLARDRELDHEVALKFLPESMIHDEEAIADLKQETRRCMGLTHPHIVRVFDFLREESAAAVSMEYVAGQTLQQAKLEREGRCFEVETIAPWIGQVCEALAYAHGPGRTVHRDLKPANVMVEAGSGRAKLTDFGIAGTLTDSMTRLTRGGMAASGTLVYMSPQQAMGYPPSVSDDVYALGAMIFELLTGKPPFYRGEILQQINQVEAPSMAERRKELGVEGAGGISPVWEETVAACLAKAVGDRPATVAAVWERLEGKAGRSGGTLGEGEGKQKENEKDEKKDRETQQKGSQPRPNQRKVALMGVGALVVVMLGGWAVKLWMGGEPKDAETVVGQGAEVVPAINPHVPSSSAPPPAPPRLLVVEIGSEPAGATILVGGTEIGKTETGSPLRHELEAGTYEIEARYRSWPVQRRTVEVVAGRAETVQFTFEPVVVRVESEPAGAEVREAASGKVLGVTPVDLDAGLEPGPVSWEVVKAGYAPHEWSGTLVAEGMDVFVRLSPSPMPSPPSGKGTGDLSAGAIGDSREYDLGGGEKLVMKYVPGGTFTMGSPEEEEGHEEEEDQVEVTLSRHFWMGETEVTQGQWKAVMGVGSNPSEFTGDENLPVETVSWDDAQMFVRKLNEKGGLPTGWAWTLPTEAQWERACRAGTETMFSFGDSLSSQMANFNGNLPFGGAPVGPRLGRTAPVKSYEANGWGLYDMHGNVNEWCLDRWDAQARLPGGVDPVGTKGNSCVNRGGSWSGNGWGCRAAYRSGYSPVERNDVVGFRVALSSQSGRGAAEGGGVQGTGGRAYLGAVADYAQEDTKGVKLIAVTSDGPAAKAGVKGGDIVIGIGAKEIVNIYDYTAILGELKADQETTIQVQRGNEKLTLKLVPGSRD